MKKAECQRIDAFELWCWRRLLRVPWTARRSNQSILKEISPEYSLERLMLKLKLQNFGHLMQRTDSLEKILVLDWRQEKGMTEDEMVAWYRWLEGYEFEQTPGVGDREAWHATVHGVAKSRTRLSDWTELNWKLFIYVSKLVTFKSPCWEEWVERTRKKPTPSIKISVWSTRARASLVFAGA